jgi:hypothetical protein
MSTLRFDPLLWLKSTTHSALASGGLLAGLWVQNDLITGKVADSSRQPSTLLGFVIGEDDTLTS